MSKQNLLPLPDAVIVRYGAIRCIFQRLEHQARENPARRNVTAWGGRRELKVGQRKAQGSVNLLHHFLDNGLKKPWNYAMQQLFSLDLLRLHGAALAALARAEERVALSPRPDIMKAQLRLLEQEALGFVEGKLVSPATLALDYGHSPGAIRQWPYEFANLFGRPLPPGKPPTADAMVQWLMANNVLQASTDTGATPQIPLDVIHHRISAWHRQTRVDCALPRLVAGADLAAKWLKLSPLTRGNAVTGVMIGDLYATARSRLSAGGVVAIGMKGFPYHIFPK
jgi:hypothetical protein